MRETGVDTHIKTETVRRQQFTCSGISMYMFVVNINNTINHLTGIIHTDDGFFLDSSVVTTTISIDDRTTENLQIGPVHLGFDHAFVGAVLRSVVVFAITTAKQLSYIGLLGFVRHLFTLCIGSHLGRETYKGVPFISNLILISLCQLFGNS